MKIALIIINFIISLSLIIYLFILTPNTFTSIEVKDFILNNPEVIIESLEKYQIEQQKQFALKSAKLIQENPELLYNNPDNPRIGAKEPTIRIVEFFDYGCGYCKKMSEVKKKILKQYPDVQIILKDMPVLGRPSYLKSKAALAAFLADPTKFQAYYESVLEGSKSLEEKDAIALAIKLGIDEKKFKDAYMDNKIDTLIKSNLELAYKLGIQGTPFYIVEGEVVGGSVTYEQIDKIIQLKKKNK